MKNLTFLLMVIFTSLIFSQTINIPSDYLTIQEGINAANDGDVVLVAEGTYFENINFKGKAITVASNFLVDQDTSHISKTIIDGSQPNNPDSGSVVYFISGEDTTSVLCGFTITGGTGTPTFVGAQKLGRAGGGIFIINASVKICNNIIHNNTVADSFTVHGGGLVAFPPYSDNWVIIENNIFNSNSCLNSTFASFGGGMQVACKSRISMNTFSNNIVSSYSGEAAGGGFAATFTLDSIFIDNNTIVGNKVETNITTIPIMDAAIGAGFILWEDTTSYIRMKGNVIANNEASGTNYLAGVGGFIEDISGDVIIANNLIYGNTYSGTPDCRGSALRLIRSRVNIINNTVTKNEPSINGGAVSTYLDSSSLLMNNIFWGNSAGQFNSEIHIMKGNAPNIIYSNIQGGWEGEGNIDVDPMFSDSLFHLSDSSECIGRGTISYNYKGNENFAPSTDFEGNVRPNPIGSKPDIGAMENTRAYPLLPVIQIPDDYPTIKAGIDAAEDGDVVLVAEGTYFENINFKGKAITVASNFLVDQDTSHISKTIIDGSQPNHPDSGSVVYFISGEDTNSVIMGFTITGGTGTLGELEPGVFGRMGGGLVVVGASSKICNNIIKNNTVEHDFVALGGGLVSGPPNFQGYLILQDNIFEFNSCYSSQFASQGGGVNLTLKALVNNNIIRNNLVYSKNGEAFGGGLTSVYNIDSVIISNNHIYSNKAQVINGDDPQYDGALGGGFMIWNDETTSIKIYNNKIYNNEVKGNVWSSGAGGSFENVQGDIQFYNNLVYNNKYDNVDCHGTGISILDDTEVCLFNNTIVDNEPSIYGGALCTWKTISTLAFNNIFWNNSGNDSNPEVSIWEGKSPEIYYSDIQGGWEGEGNIDVNPMFADTLFRLSDSSKCIGRGILSYNYNGNEIFTPSTDFEGNVRPNPIGSKPDIGADENPLGDPITAMTEELNQLPSEFALSQNYPNPFNPTTTIKYQIPSNEKRETKNVKLVVFDVLGREVATLVNEKQKPGNYEVIWDSGNQTSGVYYYRLTAGNYVETKKMILLR